MKEAEKRLKEQLDEQRRFNNNMFQRIIDTLDNHNEAIKEHSKAIEDISDMLYGGHRGVNRRVVFIMASLGIIADCIILFN